jgi:hypothetical protein
VIADRGVVVRDPVEGGDREREPRRLADRAVRPQLVEQGRVLRGVGDDRDRLPVLRGRAHHRRPADVDVLDRVVERAAGARDGRLERIEVDDQDVDRRDAVLAQRRHVGRQLAAREQAAVDLRVQRLDAAVEHLRKAGVFGDLGHREAGVGEQLGGAAGRQQPDAERRELARQLDDAGLVGYRDQRLHRDSVT